MSKYLCEISWGTEVWIAEAPTHMIHFNGDRFLGPHDLYKEKYMLEKRIQDQNVQLTAEVEVARKEIKTDNLSMSIVEIINLDRLH